MRSLGFFWKIFGGTVAVIAVTAFGVYQGALPGIERSLERESEQRVALEAAWAARLCAQAFDARSGAFDLGRLPAAPVSELGSRFTLVLPDGRVLFDSHESPAAMDDHGSRAEIEHPGRAVTRYSRTLSKHMTYFALPVEVAGELRAYARVSVPVEDREARLGDLRRAIRSGVLLAVLVALLLAGSFAWRVTQPLKAIAELVGEVGATQTTRRLRVRSEDELGRLARAVNDMADDLQGWRNRVERDRTEREAILSALAGGLLAVDEERRVRFVNEKGRVFLGGLQGRLEGQPVWELTRNTALLEVIERCLEGGRRSSGETTIATPGGERVVEISAVPLAASGGGSRGCVLELRDVSELRHLEAVRRDFVSNVSHELKTPLTAMRGYTEALLDDAEMAPELRRSFLEKAGKNTERLVAIVGDLLSLSRLESDERELAFEELDLGELTRAVLDDLRDLASSRRMRLELELPEALRGVRVRADVQALGMALANVVSNAIQYSPEGEQVRVVLSRAENELCVDVIDRGPGIPRQEQERVFERFYRVDKARSRKLGGTGLGLSIVRHAMAAHGGRVELESQPGKGCRFRLCLPPA